MAPHSFFEYLKFRVLVALFRIITRVRGFFSGQKAPLHPGVTVRTIEIESRRYGRTITVHAYEREDHNPSDAAVPVLLNFHGSGFVIPGMGADREFCSMVAARAHITVFDVDYRKAPEYPFPAATHDFQDVLLWVRDYPHRYDRNRIMVSGFSTGANVALGGVVEDKRSMPERFSEPLIPPPRIRAVIAFYPPVDVTRLHTAHDKFVPNSGHAGYRISPRLRNFFYQSYLPGASPADIRVSSAVAPPRLFPRFVYIACGTADALHTPAKELVQKLEGTMVKIPAPKGEEAKFEPRVVQFLGLEGEDHGFDKLARPGTIGEQHKVESYEAALEMIIQAIA